MATGTGFRTGYSAEIILKREFIQHVTLMMMIK